MAEREQADIELTETLLLAATTASDYEILEFLGIGCNGAVVRVRYLKGDLPRPGRLFALKMILNIHGEGAGRLRKAANNDYAVLAKLPRHPGFVRALASFVDAVPGELMRALPAETRELLDEAQSARFVVMDAHPRNLSQYREYRGRAGVAVLPWTDTQRLCHQLLDIELQLLSKHFMHRDMKPDNILVKSDDDICLCDFGEALDVVRIT